MGVYGFIILNTWTCFCSQLNINHSLNLEYKSNTDYFLNKKKMEQNLSKNKTSPSWSTFSGTCLRCRNLTHPHRFYGFGHLLHGRSSLQCFIPFQAQLHVFSTSWNNSHEIRHGKDLLVTPHLLLLQDFAANTPYILSVFSVPTISPSFNRFAPIIPV